jgi:hypothetical protein
MKELIVRDIYLIRKNLLITFGLFIGFFSMGLICILSAKYGNIAKYAFDGELINEVLEVSTAFGIVAGVILGTAVEHIYILINKDYKCGWHEYLKASGIRPETLVGVKYIMVVIIDIICLMTGVGGCQLLKVIAGAGEGVLIKGAFANQEGMIILVWFSSILLIIGGYFSSLEYAYKGKNNQKTDIIKIIPIMVVLIAFFIIFMIMEQDEEASKRLILALFDKLQNVTVLYIVPIVTSLVVTVICYLISVKIVKKEGKRV